MLATLVEDLNKVVADEKKANVEIECRYSIDERKQSKLRSRRYKAAEKSVKSSKALT